MELPTIKNHVARAIELNPDHARALQFMGGLLAELPWILGGRGDEAERLLKRAIHIDSGYTNARLVLAKLYIRQDRIERSEKSTYGVTECPQSALCLRLAAQVQIGSRAAFAVS